MAHIQRKVCAASVDGWVLEAVECLGNICRAGSNTTRELKLAHISATEPVWIQAGSRKDTTLLIPEHWLKKETKNQNY